MHRAALVCAFALLVAGGRARAEGSRLPDDSWPVRSTGPLAIDGGLVVGAPAALPTGLSTGVGAGVLYGRTLAFGARASWTGATESSTVWTVSHTDLRLRATGALQHAVGRGTLGLRLGLGATVVHESRDRNQGMRAMLTGSDLMTTAWAALPAADLEAVVTVHIAGPWLLAVAGGPSLAISDGGAHAGWTAGLGVGWQP
jgi:hypothetical protein